MDATQQLISHTTNGFVVAIGTLVQMLERRQILDAGAFAAAMKNTFNETEAEFQRPDYLVVQMIAKFLDGNFDQATH